MQRPNNGLLADIKRIGIIIALLPALVAGTAAHANANPVMLVDVGSGRVLEHEEAFRKWYPASLTKLMSVYTVFRAIRAGEVSTDTIVTMSQRAAAEPASKMYFKPGAKMTLDSALKIMMVKSANDVSVAVAEAVGGSLDGFVARMNAEAARLGMSSSRFINPHGLPGKGQYTTARDLAVLTLALRREFPEYAGYFSLEGITTGKKSYPNYNLLIGRFDGADGMKTGYICASGFNQISSATRNGRTVVSIVLGADSLGARADRSADLLQKGLTTAPSTGVRIDALAPYGEGRETVADVSAQICNPQARQVRSEGRDEAGRMKMFSPYIREMAREPNYVFAGLLPGTEVVDTKGGKSGGAPELANIPIPIPRPSF
ncbi:D-alanyl-D-alanine carboxypeptidase [Ciceribacter sp. L1K23]|nr:D-alanyl-D-alanine carboxypeptidase [Ciceribacter sp. L1K23]